MDVNVQAHNLSWLYHILNQEFEWIEVNLKDDEIRIYSDPEVAKKLLIKKLRHSTRSQYLHILYEELVNWWHTELSLRLASTQVITLSEVIDKIVEIADQLTKFHLDADHLLSQEAQNIINDYREFCLCTTIQPRERWRRVSESFPEARIMISEAWESFKQSKYLNNQNA
jgi:hypothetical protein